VGRVDEKVQHTGALTSHDGGAAAAGGAILAAAARTDHANHGSC
jgi:hypothetical protein